MILGILALCAGIILAFPETRTARWLHERLVERPVDWFSNLKRRDIILLFVMVGLFLTAGEFIAVFGASELLALAVNLSLYFDAVLVTTTATVAATIAAAWRGVRARLALWRQRGRARAHRTARKKPKPTVLDDEDAPGWAYANAAAAEYRCGASPAALRRHC